MLHIPISVASPDPESVRGRRIAYGVGRNAHMVGHGWPGLSPALGSLPSHIDSTPYNDTKFFGGNKTSIEAPIAHPTRQARNQALDRYQRTPCSSPIDRAVSSG